MSRLTRLAAAAGQAFHSTARVAAVLTFHYLARAALQMQPQQLNLSYHKFVYLLQNCHFEKKEKLNKMDKLKAVLTRREDPEAANITEDDRGFISETLDASTLSYRSFKNYVDTILGLF